MTAREFVNNLPGGDEFDYASEYLDWWLEGGREPKADYYNITPLRAAFIRSSIRTGAARNIPTAVEA